MPEDCHQLPCHAKDGGHLNFGDLGVRFKFHCFIQFHLSDVRSDGGGRGFAFPKRCEATAGVHDPLRKGTACGFGIRWIYGMKHKWLYLFPTNFIKCPRLHDQMGQITNLWTLMFFARAPRRCQERRWWKVCKKHVKTTYCTWFIISCYDWARMWHTADDVQLAKKLSGWFDDLTLLSFRGGVREHVLSASFRSTPKPFLPFRSDSPFFLVGFGYDIMSKILTHIEAIR